MLPERGAAGAGSCALLSSLALILLSGCVSEERVIYNDLVDPTTDASDPTDVDPTDVDPTDATDATDTQGATDAETDPEAETDSGTEPTDGSASTDLDGGNDDAGVWLPSSDEPMPEKFS